VQTRKKNVSATLLVTEKIAIFKKMVEIQSAKVKSVYIDPAWFYVVTLLRT
jgi:hypothetical protein